MKKENLVLVRESELNDLIEAFSYAYSKVAPLIKCSQCGTIHHGYHTCPNCGHDSGRKEGESFYPRVEILERRQQE